jgi:hypothetical protein
LPLQGPSPTIAGDYDGYGIIVAVTYDQNLQSGRWLVWAKRDASIGEAEEQAVDPHADMESNELRAGEGRICPLCDRAITHGQYVRKRVDGTYQHEDCPPHQRS